MSNAAKEPMTSVELDGLIARMNPITRKYLGKPAVECTFADLQHAGELLSLDIDLDRAANNDLGRSN